MGRQKRTPPEWEVQLLQTQRRAACIEHSIVRVIRGLVVLRRDNPSSEGEFGAAWDRLDNLCAELDTCEETLSLITEQASEWQKQKVKRMFPDGSPTTIPVQYQPLPSLKASGED